MVHDGHISMAAVPLAAGVLAFSSFCLILSLLLVITMLRCGERIDYVLYIAIFTTISTAASIAQQMHYSLEWREVKELEHQHSLNVKMGDSFSVIWSVDGLQAVFFWIQFYGYNVIALFMLMWAVSYFVAVWDIRKLQRAGRSKLLRLVSKMMAISLPVLLLGLMHIPDVSRLRIATLLLSNFPMLLNVGLGCIIVPTTIIKYLLNRRQKSHVADKLSLEEDTFSIMKPIENDRWLIYRFALAFIILSAFETWLVVFQMKRSDAMEVLTVGIEPDWSVDTIRSDILAFMPGASASACLFLIFGTASPMRAKYAQYVQFLMCASRRKIATKSKPTKKIVDEEELPDLEAVLPPIRSLTPLPSVLFSRLSRDLPSVDDAQRLQIPRLVVPASPAAFNFSLPRTAQRLDGLPSPRLI